MQKVGTAGPIGLGSLLQMLTHRTPASHPGLIHP